MPTHAPALLTRAIEDLSIAPSLEAVTRIASSAARQLAGADGVAFLVREPEHSHYVHEDAIAPLLLGRRVVGDVSGWAMDRRETTVVHDVRDDPRVHRELYLPTFVRSMAMVPVRADDPIGALGIYWADQHTPPPATLRQLEMLAHSAAVAMENLELRGALELRSQELDASAARADELEVAIHSLVHDLRSPLGAIIGFAELVSDEIDDPKVGRHVDAILRAGERMNTQIERMLSVYSITSHPPKPERVDLSALAREVRVEVLRDVGDRDVEIDVEDGMVAEVDPVLAWLLLVNLCSNAVKYTAGRPQARIHIEAVPGDGPLRTFVVRDNGVGFDQADAERLFRPLTRLETAKEFPGTGLGLASVARIVRLHGGSVRAEGERGVGASFFFSLPAPDGVGTDAAPVG
ncbi:sensor histidine kinase [Microbacterium sp. GXF7504]